MASERNNKLLRVLDRYVGIPVVAALALRRLFRRRPRPERPKRIGLLKTAGIGDTVLLSAIVRDIVKDPSVEVYLITGEANAAAARLIDGVTEVVTLPMTKPWRALATMRRYRFDLLLDFGPWPRINAILAALARAQHTVGFRTKGQWRHFAYDRVVAHSRDVHEVDNYRRLAEAAGFPSQSPPLLGRGDPVPRALLPMRPFIVCHLWSAGFNGSWKEWAPGRWQEVIEALVTGGHDVVLTGGPDDRDATAAFHRGLNAASVRVHDLSGKLDLGQTLELLRRSELVISVNTGVMHMAAVVGTPVISLEGPTPVKRWGPIGEHVTPIVSTHPGAGYLYLGWEYKGEPSDTMDGIAAQDVLRAAHAMLGDEEAGNQRTRLRARPTPARVGRVAVQAKEPQERIVGDSSTRAS